MTQCIPMKDGIPFIPWIYYIFGDCTYGFLDASSVLLGYLSILFWLNAQFPQVIENYRRGSAEGLSINFLSIWLAGDSANLIGCILTNQLPFQRYLGIYFVAIDICLLGQYLYYSKWQHRGRSTNRRKTQYESSPPNLFTAAFQHPSVQTPLLIQAQSLEDEITPYSVSSSPNKWYTLTQQQQRDENLFKTFSTGSSSSVTSAASVSSSSSSKMKTAVTGLMSIMLLGLNTFSNTSTLTTTTTMSSSSSLVATTVNSDPLIIGSLFAWTCTTLYLMSRIPQIRKNIKRRSVDGLSPSLFVFAACGNLTYASSILLHPGQTRESIMEALPYLIGSAGTLSFDFTIFLQYIYYTRRKNQLCKNNLVSV
ncbi:PQ loop repeat-domain-containing protein [Halteromyces radiatus]|uniref:PQ loop repeat-domain-containing protein n=1 Tax=Halteromyces radiatus TaxID=101107 RepID=UPI00221ED25E|nr:PQ loop repeat-domain-containing protein [Halteromyces radiatus]KAI8086163.1 PQ loop repeat-domain-containing protein [Halteromyces radiatus]